MKNELGPGLKPTRSIKSKKLGLEALWALGVRGLGTIAGFLMSLAVTRALGAVNAGYYLLGMAVITFIASFCRLGLDNTMLRLIGANSAQGKWGEVNSIFRQALIAVFLTSLVAGSTLWACSSYLADHVFHKPEMALILRALAPGIITLSLCFLLSYCLQALGKVTAAVFSQSIGTGLGVAVVSPLLTSGTEAGHAYLLISAATLCIALVWWRNSRPATTGCFPSNEIWKSAMPLWVVTGTIAIQQWAGQFVAGALVAPADVARLAVAQRTAFLISFLLIAINLVVAPRFSALSAQGNLDELKLIVKATVRLVLAVTAPLTLIIILCSGKIMNLFGPEFRDGAILLQILAIGQFINAATGPVGQLLMMTGHERDSRTIAFIVAPSAVVAALVLTPWLGVEGAAISTAVAVSTQNILAGYFVKKRLGFSTLSLW